MDRKTQFGAYTTDKRQLNRKQFTKKQQHTDNDRKQFTVIQKNRLQTTITGEN